jgi:hypothetical protein
MILIELRQSKSQSCFLFLLALDCDYSPFPGTILQSPGWLPFVVRSCLDPDHPPQVANDKLRPGLFISNVANPMP